METGNYGTDSELIREALQEKRFRVNEVETLRAKMENYRLAPEAKANLESIWFYGPEHWDLEAADKYYTALI